MPHQIRRAAARWGAIAFTLLAVSSAGCSGGNAVRGYEAELGQFPDQDAFAQLVARTLEREGYRVESYNGSILRMQWREVGPSIEQRQAGITRGRDRIEIEFRRRVLGMTLGVLRGSYQQRVEDEWEDRAVPAELRAEYESLRQRIRAIVQG